MMDSQSCRTCAFWKNCKTTDFVALDKVLIRGECHRYPPQENGHLTSFPEVYEDNWCGEYIHINANSHYYESNKTKDNIKDEKTEAIIKGKN